MLESDAASTGVAYRPEFRGFRGTRRGRPPADTRRSPRPIALPPHCRRGRVRLGLAGWPGGYITPSAHDHPQVLTG
jgi:hypothetical protein